MIKVSFAILGWLGDFSLRENDLISHRAIMFVDTIANLIEFKGRRSTRETVQQSHFSAR